MIGYPLRRIYGDSRLKVCPSCHSRFVGGETFCPHDGTKLVDARELSPGELTGTKLDEVVRLDRLIYSDGLGERYTGRLLDNRRPVFVVVFNQQLVLDSGARARVETARAKVGSPLPDQINTLLQLHLDKNPPYIIESEPRGPSIREVLAEQRQIDWKEAVRVAANLARIAQWLHDHGVPYQGVHPDSVYVTRLASGAIQIADWDVDALLTADSPERVLGESPEAFVGYVDYMPPEVATDSNAADMRSAIYSIGCLLYEMILGKPPLPARNGLEAIKRHRLEKPVRLGIARGGGEFPDSLDELIEMMIAKEPQNRFQSAQAVIAALSGLLGESPDEVAPPIERSAAPDEDDLYRTIDMESVDRNAIVKPRSADPSEAPTVPEGPSTLLRLGTRLSGQSQTRDALSVPDEDEALEELPEFPSSGRSGTGQFQRPAATTAPQEETDEDIAPRKTLLFGSIGAAVSGASRVQDDPVAADPDDTLADSKPTLLGMGDHTAAEIEAAVAAADAADAAAAAAAAAAIVAADQNDEVEEEEENAAPSGILRKRKIGKVPEPRNGARLTSSEATDDAPVDLGSLPTDETVKVQVDPGALEADRERSEASEAEEDIAHEPTVGMRSVTAASKETVPMDAATKPTVRGVQAGNIGFVEAKDHTRELDRSEWFNRSTEDAWDASLADEHHQKTEQRFRNIVIGLAVALGLVALGVYIYSEYVYTPEGAEDESATAVSAGEEKPSVDLDALKTAFDESVAAGRLVAPPKNSALYHLQELKRHGPSSPQFEGSREIFIEKAREAAKEADKAGDLASARALAGYASQYAPEDEELAKMTADFQARFTGQAPEQPAAPLTAPDAGAPDAATAEPAEEPEPEKAVAQKEPQKEKPKQRQRQRPRQKSQKKPKDKKWDAKPSSGDAAGLARDARIAFSRGDMAEARRLYHEALDKDSKNGEIYAGLGKVYFEGSNYREALKYQQKAVRYSPGRLDYRISLGQSFYRLGKYQEAIDVWEGVLKKDPDNRFARQYIELAKKKL